VVFWNRLAELYRSIAVSATLDHLFPIDSVKNGVTLLPTTSKFDWKMRFFKENSRKEQKRSEEMEKLTQLSSIPPPSTTEIARLDDWR
jgi:hypothetical protein